MRVLFDCLATYNSKTGMDTYCRLLAKYFRKLAPLSLDKPDIHFFLYKEHDYWLEPEDKRLYWKKKYIKYVNPYLLYFGNYIIHATYDYSEFFHASMLKNKNAKKIITIHHLDMAGIPLDQQSHLNDMLIKNIKIADHIVCISEATEKEVWDQFPEETKGKTSVIYNGAEEYKKEIINPKIVPDFEFIFFVGWLGEKKNVHVMVPVLQNSNLHFIIAGKPGSKKCVDKILKEAEKLGVKDKVHFVGPVSENDKQWYFKHCKAFVFPSLAEGFGIPVIEAMHHGKPCIVNKLDALVEISGDVAYYLESFEPEHVRSLFHKSMEHYNKTKPQKAIIEWAKRYSWEKSAKQYLELYSQVVRQ